MGHSKHVRRHVSMSCGGSQKQDRLRQEAPGNSLLAHQALVRHVCSPSPFQVNDPYTVLIREKKLPLSLLEDPEKKHAGAGRRCTCRAALHAAAAWLLHCGWLQLRE